MSMFFDLVITMLTNGVLEKIPKAALKTADVDVIHSSCECHLGAKSIFMGPRT